MKILIVKRDKLGDLLLTTPMLALLREALPGAEIHVLASRYSAWVLAGHPAVDRLWTYDAVRGFDPLGAWRQLRLYFALRGTRFDVAIAAGGEESPRAIARALHTGAKRVIAYAAAPALRKRLSDPQEPPCSGHESRRIAAQLAPLGIALPAQLPPVRFQPDAAIQRFADEWLRTRGLRRGGYVVIGIGARDAVKKPTTAQILRWSEWLHRRWHLATIFTWTPGQADDARYLSDDDIAAPVIEAAKPWIHPYCGPIRETIGLIFGARASIFPDSGLMHFAAASPGGVLGFFCQSHFLPSPDKWAPLGPRAHFLDAPLAVAEIDDNAVFEKLGLLL